MMPTQLLSLFGPLASPFLVPAKTASAAARRRGQGRPIGRRALRAPLDGDEHGRTLVVAGLIARTSRARRAAAVASLLAFALEFVCGGLANAQVIGSDRQQIGAHFAEASRRSGLPEDWIRAVAWVESRGASQAVSPKGAMGLMQIMPATWRDLRADLGLGNDPFDHRDNLVAGAVYLRRMFDRFGAGGFLAAYNAGPSRYQAFLDGRMKLPAETIAYTARVRGRLTIAASSEPLTPAFSRFNWRTSGLFVGREIARPELQGDGAIQPLFASSGQEPVR